MLFEDIWISKNRRNSSQNRNTSLSDNKSKEKNFPPGHFISPEFDLFPGPKEVLSIQTEKIVIFGRDPPKGYSVHQLSGAFTFLISGFVPQRNSVSQINTLEALLSKNTPVKQSVLLHNKKSEASVIFNKIFSNCFSPECQIFSQIKILEEVRAQAEAEQFRSLRFKKILKKLVKLDEPIVMEKLKELRFGIFSKAIRRFGQALFSNATRGLFPNPAFTRLKREISNKVLDEIDLQRATEFLILKLALSTPKSQINENQSRNPKVFLKKSKHKTKGSGTSYTELAQKQLKLNSKRISPQESRNDLKWQFSRLNYFKLLNQNYKLEGDEIEFNPLFLYPCECQQLFESFYCGIYPSDPDVTNGQELRLVSLMNITKNISQVISLSRVKLALPYEMSNGDPGLEIFFSDFESLLISFQLEDQRDNVLEFIKSNSENLEEVDLQSSTKIWMEGLLPSFEYLMLLNRLANRSFHDITQYPIFPWVISDYFSDRFVKNEKVQYRTLTDPVGVLSAHRKQRAQELFESLKSDSRRLRPPCHQTVFVSSPGYILFFYMRLVPAIVVRLQSSAFSPSEKIFKSFESLWASIHSGVNYPSELIPEFFSLNHSEIFQNRHQIVLGSKIYYLSFLI